MDSSAWMNTNLDPRERAKMLREEMTLEEKVGQLEITLNVSVEKDAKALESGSIGTTIIASGEWAGNISDGGVRAQFVRSLQREAVERHRLGVPLLVARDVIHGHRTVMPIPLGGAASFDPELHEAGLRAACEQAILDEISWTFTPMIDISDDPRWGRISESFGEDPYVSEIMAAAAVRGVQNAGTTDPSKPRIAACMKHFVGYGLARGGRDYGTVEVGENTLRNVHLRPYKAAVDAGCLTLMAAFNDIDGTPMHANRYLLRNILRDEWGFDGVVTADWNGIGELVKHGLAEDGREAARLGIEAGVDVDMLSGVYVQYLPELVRSGDVSEELIDEACERVLTLKFRLGLFDRDWSLNQGPESVWKTGPSNEHQELSRRTALGAMTLINNAGLLPLSPTDSLHVTGPFATERDSILGTWCLDGVGAETETIVEAIGKIHTGPFSWDDGRFADLAARKVIHANAALVLLGEHRLSSGEANSLSRLTLPAGQIEFLRQIRMQHERVVTVVLAGRPLDISEVVQLSDAVLWSFHPGSMGAQAIAQVLYGTEEPAGRLPVTLPPSTGHVPLTVREKRTSRPLSPYRQDGWERRYVDAPTPPAYHFGAGGGYGHFDIHTPQLSHSTVQRGGKIDITCNVVNQGQRSGRSLVQLYMSDPAASVTRPWRELIDFAWVEVDAGAHTDVRFEVATDKFGYWGRENRWRVDAGEIFLGIGLNAGDIQWAPALIVE